MANVDYDCDERQKQETSIFQKGQIWLLCGYDYARRIVHIGDHGLITVEDPDGRRSSRSHLGKMFKDLSGKTHPKDLGRMYDPKRDGNVKIPEDWLDPNQKMFDRDKDGIRNDAMRGVLKRAQKLVEESLKSDPLHSLQRCYDMPNSFGVSQWRNPLC